jgi:hypothetical protein
VKAAPDLRGPARAGRGLAEQLDPMDYLASQRQHAAVRGPVKTKSYAGSGKLLRRDWVEGAGKNGTVQNYGQVTKPWGSVHGYR